jgi:serine/threonine protein kinase
MSDRSCRDFRMLQTSSRNREPIPGYLLIEPLGRGGFGEVWKCEAPGGLYKAIKFVEGGRSLALGDAVPAVEELKAIQHIKSLRHPFLLSMERVELIDGELVIVMELADKSLMDVFHEHRAKGAPGIPREELLRYLHEAADVLDLMNLQYGLQHLDIKPGNLFLVSNHVKVADFGLVRSLADRSASTENALLSGGLTALYAAPEMFRNTISSSCDQYSLAIVYQELLTGVRPFNGKNVRQLLMQHCTAEPDLEALPESDRAVVARALSKEPGQRFPTCMAFVQALQASGKFPQDTASLTETLRSGSVLDGIGDRQKTPLPDAALRETERRAPAQARFLPDYQFHGCLGRTPFTETWEAQTPEGKHRQVKVLFGVTWPNTAREQEAIERMQSIRHPVLPPMRALSGGPGCLIVDTDSLRVSLRDRFQEYRNDGERGIPRRQLLDWLRPIAAALDELSQRYDLQHLGLHPRCLLFDGDELRIADFGLLLLVWRPTGQLHGQLQARYAAPELYEQQMIGPACDSYSLAVIFQEMLTGTTPWRGRRSGLPILEPLSPSDRAVLARALDIDPGQRFPTCAELVSALEGAQSRDSDPLLRGEGLPATSAIIAELIVESKRALPVTETEGWAAAPAGAGVLQGRFPARLSPQNARAGFETFRRQWNAQVVRETENSLVFQVPFPGSFWKRWFGGTRRLLVEVRWTRPRPASAALPELSVRICCPDKKIRPDEPLVREVGPLLLDSLRSQLEAYPERRTQERVSWPHPVRATFLLAENAPGETIEGRGKDISLGGMGLYLPRAPAGSQIQLELLTPSRSEPIALSGHCIRVQRCSDGWFETGVLF